MRPVERIAVANGNGINFIPQSEILYCIAEGNYTLIHLSTGKKITSAKTLKQVEQALPANQFVRIHHSYITNLFHIQTFQNEPEPTITMSDGKKLSVSRRRKKAFLEKFIVL